MDSSCVERALLGYRDSNCYVSHTKNKVGLGVFATRDLEVGTEIGDYQGELMGSKDVRERAEGGGFRMEVGEDSGLYIDPVDENGRFKSVCVCNFINEPAPDEACNAAFFVDTANSRIYVRTVRTVKTFEEILVSYGAHFPRNYEVNITECFQPGSYWEEMIKKPKSLEDLNKNQIDNNDDNNDDDDETTCYLCGHGPSTNFGPFEPFSEKKIHQNCMKWTKGTTKDEKQKSINSFENARCYSCDQKKATIICGKVNCKRYFHYPCALKVGCLFIETRLQLYCVDHKEEELKSVITPINQQLGSGDLAWRSFKRAKNCGTIEKTKLKFQEQCRSTEFVTDIRDAIKVEVLCQTEEYAGTWWSGCILGYFDGLALIRYDDYTEENDEWLPFKNIRYSGDLISSCSELKVGGRYQVFSSARVWQDAQVVSIDRSPNCSDDIFCKSCSAVVRYQTTGKKLSKTKQQLIKPIVEKISLIGSPFSILEIKHSNNNSDNQQMLNTSPFKEEKDLNNKKILKEEKDLNNNEESSPKRQKIKTE